MKKILIALSAVYAVSVYANNSFSPKTIPSGAKTIKMNIPSNIFWVTFEDDTEARFRALNYYELKYNLDEGESHNYLLNIRLKPIDDPNLPVIDCETDVNYYYKLKEISYNSVQGRWCKPLQY